MAMDGRPEGSNIRGDNEDPLVSQGIHHDPLNENNEETWSALGDQEEPSTGNNPGALSPSVPLLPASSGNIIGQARPIVLNSSGSSLYQESDDSLLNTAVYSSSSKEVPEHEEESKCPLRLEVEFTPSNHLQVGLVTSVPEEIFGKIAYSPEDAKSSKLYLSSKSSPSLCFSRACSKSSFGSGRSGSLFCRICHEGGCSEHFISPCCCRGSLSRVHKNCLERWLAESDSSHCELCGFKYRTKRVPKYGLIFSIFAWLTSSSTSRERRHLLFDLMALLIISPIIGFSTIMALQLADSLFMIDTLEPHDVRADPRRAELLDLPPKSKRLQRLKHFLASSKLALVEVLLPLLQHHSLEVVGAMMSRLGQMGMISLVITMDMAYVSWVAMRLQSHVTKWYSWYRRNCKVTLVGYPDQVMQQPFQRMSSISVHEISF